jgi:long-chain acyl-CoA synthetase
MRPDDHPPDKPAVIMGATGATLTYGQLAERTRRFARFLRERGLVEGNSIALMLENRAEFFELAWGAHRLGLYYTPVNWHLQSDEVAYIVQDCGARVFIASDHVADAAVRLGDVVGRVADRLIVGDCTARHAFTSYEATVAAASSAPVDDEIEGQPMLYSSGTTGLPKGIKRLLGRARFGTPTWTESMMRERFGVDASSVFLCPGPLYHAAPLAWSMSAQRLGATVVVMERFDPLEALRLIERHGVTHTLMVPTHFVRMLKLPEADRHRFDLSSLHFAVHAGAPCPIAVKEQMLDWWGPIVHEFYSCTEGVGFVLIGPEEWRTHKGSVGLPVDCRVTIVGEDGRELAPGEPGVVYFESAVGFAYHNDPEKTAAAHDARGHSTVGDIGFVDQEGYLYLTDRVSHMIISGGVNIYPQEVENLLTTHPAVLDVAVIGVPNSEFGEEVKAVVLPADPAMAGPQLAMELVEHCRRQLAHYKCPRSVDFVEDLPRLPTGKLAKRLLRARYQDLATS